MRIRLEKDVLVAGLNTASRAIITRGPTSPALSGVHIEFDGQRVVFTGTNLDMTIQTSVECSQGEPGICVLPAKLLTDITKALEPGRVDLEVQSDQATLTSGRSRFELRTIVPEEFPKINVRPDGARATISSAEFARALKQVVPAASTDELRQVLTGVLVESDEAGLKVVATDSYRLALREVPGLTLPDQISKVVVPSRALAELQRLIGEAEHLQVTLADKEVAFAIENTTLLTRLIEGDFPSYRQLLPASCPNVLVVSKESLVAALRRVRIFAQEGGPVRLHLSSEGLGISAISPEVGEAREELEASYTGEEMTTAFNPEFLTAGTEACSSDEIMLELVEPLKPALLSSPGEKDFKYLLMPVRI